MDKKPIPTKKITIGKGDDKKTVEVYEYLTQEEEDQRLAILAGEKDIEMSATGEIKLLSNIKSLSAAKKYLVEVMCIDLNIEDFNIMRPSLRNELMEKLDQLAGEVKKE